MKQSKQQGFTLIEIMVVLAIGALLLTAMGAAFQTYGDNVANRAVADQQRKIRDAGMQYIQDNAGTIAAAAGPTTPFTITIPTLISAGYLPAGFTAANAYSLDTTIKVVEPTAGKLQGWVVASPPASAARVSGQNLRKIAQLIGADGGFAEAQGAGVTARGAYGGWASSMDAIGGSPSNSVVATAMFVTEASGSGGVSGDALMRTQTAGQPELNRMSTNLDMGGNTLSNAAAVIATEVVGGNFSIGGTRHGAGSWPYEAISLPAGNNMRFFIGGTQQAVVQSDGWINARTGFTTAGNVAAWDVIANGGVNSNNHVYGRTQLLTDGELYATGWLRTRGDTGWYSEKWCGGWYMADATWIRSYCGKNVYVNAEVRANRISTEARISAGEYLDVNGWASRGGWCEKHGLIGQDGNGMLFCRGNTWIGTGAPTGGSYTYLGLFTGTYVGYNTSAYTSTVIVSAQAYACGNNGYSVQMYVNGGWIGVVQDNNRTDAKVGHATFNVPAGGNFQITPQFTSYCNTQAHVWQYTQS